MGDGISTYDRSYNEITDKNSLAEKINGYLEEYNDCCHKPMNLVLFDFAIEHILRICRILRVCAGTSPV